MYFNLLFCRRQMNAKKKQDHQVWWGICGRIGLVGVQTSQIVT